MCCCFLINLAVLYHVSGLDFSPQDEISKRNWERFGNPDGPQIAKVGIGLPRRLAPAHIYTLIGRLMPFLHIIYKPIICPFVY